MDIDVFKLSRDGFKQNDLDVGLGVSGFLWPMSKLNDDNEDDDDDGNNDGRKNIGLLVWLSKKKKNIIILFLMSIIKLWSEY